MSAALRGLAAFSFHQERTMKRIVFACAAMALGAGAVAAASPAVESAVKTITALGADPAKLKLFCELNNVVQALGEKEDPQLDKQMEDLIAKLGPEFTAAWEVGDDLDENSEDGQAFFGAVDALSDKCK
jgi:hypothetical protein